MDEDVNTAKDISKNTGGDREEDVPRPKIPKKKIMVNTPEPEQLATLNLKEGKNIVVFTFSTAMLGKQQVIWWTSFFSLHLPFVFEHFQETTSSFYVSVANASMFIICLRCLLHRLMHVYICGDGTQKL